MKNRITKKTTLEEVLKEQEAQEILADYDLPCLHCPMARYEMSNITLAEISKQYNIDLKGLLRALNEG